MTNFLNRFFATHLPNKLIASSSSKAEKLIQKKKSCAS